MRKRMMPRTRRRRSRPSSWVVRLAPVVVATLIAIPVLVANRPHEGPVPLAALGAGTHVGANVTVFVHGPVPDGRDRTVSAPSIESIGRRLADPTGFIAAALGNARAELMVRAQVKAAAIAAQKPISLIRPAAAKTTTKPASTTKTTTKPTTKTTTKPTTKTTTKPATTTTRPTVLVTPTRTYTQAEVQQIIRSIWPADLADKALAIAWRESNLIPTAHNWCCTGLFQIYATANAQTIAALGYTASQLTDPEVNTRVAYAMYLRSGWAPWA